MSDHEIKPRLRGLKHLVGNTPLLAVEITVRGDRRVIYAKAEHMNLTGSIKDRMALHIVGQGYSRGALQPGGLVVEATSGNTGISFAAIGRAMGHPVAIFMPDWMSRERIDLIRSLGAQVHLVSKEQDGFRGSIRMGEELANSTEGAFLPRQFSNEDNIEAHSLTTGPEICWQLRFLGIKPDAVVAGVGTGGTIMGVGQFLRYEHPAVKLHPLEPANSPTLTTGYKVGKHRIQGISDEFIPPIVDLDFLDEVVSVDDGDAVIMAQRLAAELGIGVGISSGANFLGAVKIQDAMPPGSVVVTVFPDDNKKYLSTALLGDEPVHEGFLGPDIELLGYRAYKRVCNTCCEPDDCAQQAADRPHGLDDADPPPCPRSQRQGDGHCKS